MNFKRSFFNEFTALVRQTQSTQNVLEIDDFMDKLTTDVVSIIEAPLNPIDINTQSISRKISAAIEDHTKPVSSTLAEVESKNSVASEHHIKALKQLQDEIDNIRQIFKSGSESVLRELEKERQIAAQKRDSEMSVKMEIEQRMRTLNLKKIELEAKARNQKVEGEGLARSMKKFEAKRKQWEESTLPKLLDESSAVKERILEELDSMKNEITPGLYDDLYNVINEGINIIKDEGESLKNDLIGIDMANRWLMSKPKSTTVVRSPKKLKRSSVLDQTQEKLSRIKRQRAESIKDITEL